MNSSSIINQAVEAVMDLIDALDLYTTISLGALGTGNDLVCGIGPSGADEVYMDKNQFIVLDFTLNGKHTDLQTLSDALNKIHEELTMMHEYPSAEGWQIIDIQTITLPQQIGREDSNAWVMASSLAVKLATYTRNQQQNAETPQNTEQPQNAESQQDAEQPQNAE